MKHLGLFFFNLGMTFLALMLIMAMSTPKGKDDMLYLLIAASAVITTIIHANKPTTNE